MLRQYLAFLLTALIALQSVAAVADAHQFHQSGTEHLTFDHDHSRLTDKLQPKRQSKIDNPDVSTNLDCCHCHGHGSVVLIGVASHVADLFSQNGHADYQASLTSGIPPSLFRPPIA